MKLHDYCIVLRWNEGLFLGKNDVFLGINNIKFIFRPYIRNQPTPANLYLHVQSYIFGGKYRQPSYNTIEGIPEFYFQ